MTVTSIITEPVEVNSVDTTGLRYPNPREVERELYARTILFVLQNPMGIETIDWEIADAVIFMRDKFIRVDEAKATAAVDTDADDPMDGLIEALTRIVQWSEAYPIAVFPEPDFKKASELLQAGGITLDAVASSCMRHVVNGVGKIARDALAELDHE